MDSEFDMRWRQAEAPFDGVTIFLTDFVPLSALRPMLIAVVNVLHAYCPHSHLFRLEDWHEHDGYVKEATPTTWQELQAALASVDALQRESMGDTYVRTAWFPQERDFLLRFYIPDIYDNPYFDHDDPHLVHHGIFDVTVQEPLASQVQAAAQEAGAVINSMPAKAFFDRNYSG
jgi:hypothetical protein